jgi:hypothetical protein
VGHKERNGPFDAAEMVRLLHVGRRRARTGKRGNWKTCSEAVGGVKRGQPLDAGAIRCRRSGARRYAMLVDFCCCKREFAFPSSLPGIDWRDV